MRAACAREEPVSSGNLDGGTIESNKGGGGGEEDLARPSMAGSRERRSTRAAAWSMGAARAEVAADLAGVEGGGAAGRRRREMRGEGDRGRGRGRGRERGSEVGGHNTNGAPPLGAP